ncbi:MAG: hypothetical protein AB8G18_03020 [Gammaproteobacteria bacterium]
MDAYSQAQTKTSSAKTFTWLIRRELWEHRAFWIVPAVVMGIILLTHVVALFKGSQHLNIAGDMLPTIDGLNKSMVPVFGEVVMLALVAIFGVATGIVSVFYLLDSLYSERRDRSVLFWKSLPITDTATVGSKLFTGVVVLPLVALVAAFVTYVCILLLLTLAFGFREGFPLFGLWNPLSMLSSISKWLVLTLTQQVWFLPLYAWLLFCSAFARKAPFLVAVLVPLGITLAENLAYRHSYLSDIIGGYFVGFFTVVEENSPHVGGGIDFSTGENSMSAETISIVDILQVFTQGQLYVGLAVAAILIFATIWWRRNHVELG